MYVPICHAELSPVVHCNALLIYYPKYRDDMFGGKLVGKYISRLWRLSNSFRQKPTMIEKKFLQFQHILQYTTHRRGSKFQWKGTTPFSYLNFDYTDINIYISFETFHFFYMTSTLFYGNKGCNIAFWIRQIMSIFDNK